MTLLIGLFAFGQNALSRDFATTFGSVVPGLVFGSNTSAQTGLTVKNDQTEEIVSDGISTQDLLDSLYRHGSKLMQERKFEEASLHYASGLSLATKTQDSLYIGRFYNGMGAVAQYEHAPEKAIEMYHKSMLYIKEDRYPEEVSKVYINLGALYAGSKDFPNARTYLEKALGMLEESSEVRLHVMTNLVAMYFDLGDYSEGEKLAKEAIPMAEERGNQFVLSALYTNLSKIYSEDSRWELAIEAGKKALSIKESTQQGKPLAALNNIGHAYQMSGQYQKAEEYYHEALGYAEGEEKLPILINLKNTATKQGDFRRALGYLEDYSHIDDSLSQLHLKAQIAEITEKYEANKKQQQIDILQAENELQEQLIRQQRILAIGVSVLVLLLGGLVYIWFKQVRTKQALDRTALQQRFLRSQLNPHFIFNALQSVQNFIYKNDGKKSMEYLNSFSKLIRTVLETSDQEEISLAEEIQMTKDFLRLHQLNANNSFAYDVSTRNIDDLDGVFIPVMLVQPFVENAIVHGIKNRMDGLINVYFEIEESHLIAEITDNGNGIRASKSQAHRSMGKEIINKRIQAYNTSHKEKITISYSACCEDADFPGTKVRIAIPLLN
ncbi:tetratricopeptide repeat protein [Belliella marina]|uniref:Tetratricopeptide repeat protein n=1 Tax=Belliella marina TaxID=1644146 RepID=A0ABW4VNB8_9BACT